MRDRFVEIDVRTFVIEVHAHVWMTLSRFNHRRVQRGASDRIDVLFWVDIVRREMKITGFVVDHSAAHWDSVLQHFVGDAELFERVNSARGKCEIDRPSAHNVAFARISASFVKIDIVAAAT